MNSFTYELNGKELKFRLTSSDCLEIEEKYKTKLLDFIQDYSMTAIITLLRYMRKSDVPNFSKTEACVLFDDLINSGLGFEDILTKIIYPTAVVSGFLKQSDLDKMLNEMEEKKEAIEKAE